MASDEMCKWDGGSEIEGKNTKKQKKRQNKRGGRERREVGAKKWGKDDGGDREEGRQKK
jgi:hypothetical protein